MNQGLEYEISQVMPQALATGLFTSLCTIQRPSGNYGPSGAPDGLYVNITGLVNVPCFDSVPSMLRIQATEMKAVEEIQAYGLRHVAMNGYYPQIIAGWRQGWRAVVDGVLYDIMGAEPDSQTTQTRLALRLVTI